TGGILFGGTDLTANGASQNIAALFIGLAAYAVLLFVLAYSLAIWNTGATIIYCLLVRKKDDKDLLAEKESDELITEEAASPQAVPEAAPAQPASSGPGSASSA
ncbi:MAG: hypothetical protein ABIK62_06620, partial [candidate division WOR-3 bacterium]